MRRVHLLATMALAFLTTPGALVAQQAQQAPARASIQTKIDVVLSRFQGEKKTSSLPFTLWVNVPPPRMSGSTPITEYGHATLRMGVDVPVGSKTTTSARTSGSMTTTDQDNTTQYRNVGTAIDCQVAQMEDGRFLIGVTVQDSSIYSTDQPARGVPRITDPLAFRTFSLTNNLPMRDGQTLQYATATDKISGETVKVDVTLTVLK